MPARALAAMLLLCACDAPAGPDGGADAGRDAGRERDARVEAGPMCEPGCEGDETCCAEEDGTFVCALLRNDPRHCGLCTIDCVETHRGDSCAVNQCACGASRLGCTGNRQSWCCPPRAPGTSAYCTDLDRSAADCGACGVQCDLRVADHCDGGECVCGTERGPCAGTPESLCCADGIDVACADTTSSRIHCGGCNRTCEASERCVEGTCTDGTACPGGCAADEVCCNGACCDSPGRCIGGACASAAPDAGVDAG